MVYKMTRKNTPSNKIMDAGKNERSKEKDNGIKKQNSYKGNVSAKPEGGKYKGKGRSDKEELGGYKGKSSNSKDDRYKSKSGKDVKEDGRYENTGKKQEDRKYSDQNKSYGTKYEKTGFSGSKNRDSKLRKNDAIYKKNDVAFKKNDPEYKKNDETYKNNDSEHKKNDVAFKKNDAAFKKNDAVFKKNNRKFDKSNPRDRNPVEDFSSYYEFEGEDFAPQEDGIDRIEGRNSVLEAIKSDRAINKILISRGEKEGSIKQIIALAKEKKLVVQETERANLDKISITHAHQGVIAFVSFKDYVDVDDIIRAAKEKNEAPFIIVLDGVTDPYNLGSILRTADSVGAHGVIIPKRRAIGLNAAVSKASAGAIEYVPVARVTNIAQTLDYLKKQNIWVIGTDQTGKNSFYNTDLKGPTALVIGSEGEGMGRLVAEKCDLIVNIPMRGNISSLNAAVAGAIVLYEILRQRSM